MKRNGREPPVLAILKALHLSGDHKFGNEFKLLTALLSYCDEKRLDPRGPVELSMTFRELSDITFGASRSALETWRETLREKELLDYEPQGGQRRPVAYTLNCAQICPLPATTTTELSENAGVGVENPLPATTTTKEGSLPATRATGCMQLGQPTRARVPEPSPDPIPPTPLSQPDASESVRMTNALHQKLTGSGGPRWGFKTDPDLRAELDRLIASGMSYDEIENLCVVATDNARRAPSNWNFYVAVLDTEYRERLRGNGIPGIVRALGRSPSEEAVWDYLKTHDLVADYHPERMAQLVGAIGSFRDQAYTVGRLNDARESYVRRQRDRDHGADVAGVDAAHKAASGPVG